MSDDNDDFSSPLPRRRIVGRCKHTEVSTRTVRAKHTRYSSETVVEVRTNTTTGVRLECGHVALAAWQRRGAATACCVNCDRVARGEEPYLQEGWEDVPHE